MTEYVQAICVKGDKVGVLYRSGARSENARVAQFFSVMADRGAELRDIGAYIAFARHSDFETDWAEAKRILATFEGKKHHLPKKRRTA